MEVILAFVLKTVTLLAACALGVAGHAELRPHRSAFIVRCDLFPPQSALTIGGFIFASPLLRSPDDDHEWGHLQQEQLLGETLYLAFVALPSVIVAVSYPQTWFMHWPETWADELGGVER